MQRMQRMQGQLFFLWAGIMHNLYVIEVRYNISPLSPLSLPLYRRHAVLLEEVVREAEMVVAEETTVSRERRRMGGFEHQMP